MSHLSKSDRVLLAALLSIWVACFAFSVRDLWFEFGTPSVFVTAPDSAEGYPTVLGYVPWWRGAESGLQSGDRLLRFGEQDLAGVGPVAFRGIVAEQSTPNFPTEVVYERAGRRGKTDLRSGRLSMDWPLVPTSLVFALTAALLFLRAPPSPTVRSYFTASMVAAIALVSLFGANVGEVYASFLVTFIAASLVGPLGVRAALHFVDRADGRLARFVPWVFVVGGVPHVGRVFATPIAPNLSNVLAFVLLLAWGSATLFVMTRSYQQLDDVRRQRLKWIVLGLYLGFIPTMVAAAVTAVDPRFLWLYEDAITGFVALPVFVAISTSRYHLFHVDRLISATVSYSVLITCGLALGLAAVPVLADAAENVLGFDPIASYATLGLALACVIVPLHRRLSPWLRRKFFPESVALAAGVHEFLRELGRCETLTELALVSGAHMSAVLRPRVCAVYSRVDDRLTSTFVRGPAAAPVLPCSSGLARALGHVGQSVRRVDLPDLPAEDGAWLDSLSTEVLVPVFHGTSLAGLMSLGSKRSEAPYTDGDLALLSAVAEKGSSEIARLLADRPPSNEVETLRARQRELEADLRAAAEVQRSVMPATPPTFPDLEIAWRFCPCEAVGGDLLQVESIDERHVAFYVIDVSGHGVAAAMLSVSIAENLTLEHGIVAERREGVFEPRSPARVLELLDERYPMERSSKFFTIFYAVFDRETRRLSYCRGGHPTPMLFRADGSVENLEAGGTIIGLGGLTAFEDAEVSVRPGDRLFVYSDGVTEYANLDDEMFGEERLRALLQERREESIDAQCASVLTEARAFAGLAEADDDITVLGVAFGEKTD